MVYTLSLYLKFLSLGEGFSYKFDLTSKHVVQDQKAKDFIDLIYKNLYNKNDSELSCIETGICKISRNLSSNEIVFELPSLIMSFQNNRNRTS